jgi:sigma-B regulation protein RsbU (phosphoserine phosphatase)
VILPVLALSLLLAIAKDTFEADKLAYVFDASLSVTRTKAARVSSELQSVVSVCQALVFSYQPETQNLSGSGVAFFDREMKLESFRLYGWNPGTASYESIVDLRKPTGGRFLEGKDSLQLGLVPLTSQYPVAVRNVAGVADRLLLAVRFGAIEDERHVVAVALFEASELQSLLSENRSIASFLAGKSDGVALLGKWPLAQEWSSAMILDRLASEKERSLLAPELTAEIEGPQGRRYLASYVDSGVGGLAVVSLVERADALAATSVLMRKSYLFFVVIISLTMIVAVVVSRRITTALARLSAAAERIAAGDFSVRVDVPAQDEVGRLAQTFNHMTGEVERLMVGATEKARMEFELSTAKAVQSSVFPESEAVYGPCK